MADRVATAPGMTATAGASERRCRGTAGVQCAHAPPVLRLRLAPDRRPDRARGSRRADVDDRRPLGSRAAARRRPSREIDVLLPSNAAITAEVIAAAPRLRLIQQPAAGTEGIDRAAAAARGIPICNAPGTNHVAVAEHALFLLLALARRAPRAHRAFADRQIGVPLGIELAGKTLGIIGMGRSGTALAERARALGMTVRRARPRRDRRPRARSSPRATRSASTARSTPETRGLVDAAAFAAMRPGALVVNCARGGVIDREALRRRARGRPARRRRARRPLGRAARSRPIRCTPIRA